MKKTHSSLLPISCLPTGPHIPSCPAPPAGGGGSEPIPVPFKPSAPPSPDTGADPRPAAFLLPSQKNKTKRTAKL